MQVISSISDVITALKTTPRQGWVDHGIENPETVYEHSMEVSAMALRYGEALFGDAKGEICQRLGCVHDITESIVPDITPYMNLTRAQKGQLELIAINHIAAIGGSEGKWIKALWLQFEMQQTDEAKLVHQIDKLQMAQRAVRYEAEGRCSYSLKPFIDDAEKHLAGTQLEPMFREVQLGMLAVTSSKPQLLRIKDVRPDRFERLKKQVRCKIGRSI